MDIQHLRAFVEVAEQGSFAHAARRLALDPSAVTRAVATLEATLGARLLQRTTRKVALTEAGAIYLERVRPILEELEVANEELQTSTEQVRGTVRVTASVAYGQAMLVPLLPALHAEHPALEVDLLLSDAVVDVVSQRIDVALRLGPANDSSLIGMQLRPIRFRVCASPAYLQKNGRPRVPSDLTQCECLRFPLPGYRTQWTFRDRAGQIEIVPVSGWLVMSTALALHRAALDGWGPALLGDWLIDTDIAAGRLVDLFPKYEATATNFDSALTLLYASRQHLPRRVRTFVDFVKTRLG
ncbi:MAG: LysR family transcriptional regulator [Hydrogenophaga sp.]|uniref:LysR family transcriptional regulator n=1 Tax=Hydrogenophaga sp. TaxID=1904254 RepID=UPI0026178E84|nr:LysR family transcriptional regulator [Hydrogenophaga sp.]MCV0440920.1 LysR family transcriptional regulator [Hydrogenophaga sp.]